MYLYIRCTVYVVFLFFLEWGNKNIRSLDFNVSIISNNNTAKFHIHQIN